MSTSLTTQTSEVVTDPMQFIENPSASALQAALAEGNLAKLSTEQRLQFLSAVCKSVGLNPLTQPFEFISFQGKIRLYVKRDATDQLRKIHEVSITIADRSAMQDLFVVTAKATTPSGRCDESIGAVLVKGLTGESLAIALMKCETKAKRRVTLSICGLGFMDESEIEDAQKAEEQQARRQTYGGNDHPAKPQAEGMETTEAEVLPPDHAPRHWSDLMPENAYNSVTFPEGTEWAGKALWEVAKEKGFEKAFKDIPRDDSVIRHALDARYFANLKTRLAKKGYDLDEATVELRKSGFLTGDTQIMEVPGEHLQDLGAAINDLPAITAQ